MLAVKVKVKLNHFSFMAEIAVKNEILVVHGPSGCGKTTLLKCIAGLILPKDGFIRLNGRTLYSSIDKINIPTRLRRIGFVFQDYALFPHKTVEQNVSYGLTVNRKANSNKEHVAQMLSTMKIEHLKNRFPMYLSGGEKQRVAIARALMTRPELLLLDEPLSAVDADTRLELQKELKAIQKQWNIPFILVTHDREEAGRLGDIRVQFTASEQGFSLSLANDSPAREWFNAL